MSTDVIADTVPLPKAQVPLPVGLSSPPDSNSALKLDGSDSELSDIEEPEEDIGDVVPDRYENGVPIYMPTMAQFRHFAPYVNKLNSVGMKTGIVKVIPPAEWKANLPSLDKAIKTIKVKDPIAQEIMGTGGTYRQVNIQHQRSYNLPQWRQLCEQSEHQPPAKRGERRANQEISTRMGSRSKGTSNTGTTGARKRGLGRHAKKQLNAETPDGIGKLEEIDERLPTPVSPPIKAEDDVHADKNEVDEEVKSSSKVKSGRQPKAIASVSSRRKYNRREAAGKIDEEAFKDFEYRLLDEEFTKERCEDLERAYWKTLTYAPPLYGADMPGSLFDDRTESWNLGKLDNLLDILGTKIPGVNTAYLYLGMWKATFAWHLEDVDLYSINYNHFGAPKQWYSISQKDARRFEAAMKGIWPVDAKSCDQFLRHKTFLISPATLLEKYNVKVNKAVQHPGEFVITFPYGYHSGFNMGYNAAEAVNFATESWLEFGRVAKKCECEQAQDSVWIDAHDMRKLRGEETEFEESDDEVEDEGEDGPNDLPTPPESSGDARLKGAKKRKRPVKDKRGEAAKRIRIRIPAKQPCVLCPNDILSEPLLPTDDGFKAHRICALYIPETEIEPGTTEIVTGTASISKARLELKCNYCRSKKGAAFQCSQKKCTRAYHATCALAAGVFVEEGERPVFGPDGTEYKEYGFEFSCRFHRTKRDKKFDGDALEDDRRIQKAACDLKTGDRCQFQYHRGDIFAGIVIENRRDEELLLVDILPKPSGEPFEIGYKWLLLPDPADYRMPKPSANAIPLPRKSKQSLVTSKRQANDLPRKEDPFLPGFTWEEFHTNKLDRNLAQVKVDLAKENQIWFYLGKTSTDAKAQFTEDPKKPRHNPKGHFLDTIAKPPPQLSSRQSYPASYPSAGVNQHALNAARASGGRSSLIHMNARSEKPYEYKPRGGNDSFRVDAQAYRSQQKFIQKSAIPYAFGSDPRYGMEPKWPPASERAPSSYQTYRPTGGQPSPSLSSMGPPFAPQSRLSSSTHIPPKLTSALGSLPTPNYNNSSRTSSGTRYNAKPNPFAKYPYLQKQHNRSPLDYKSPYSQGGGFMNGYEGDLKEHLRRNPEALFRTQRAASQPSSLTANPLLACNTSSQNYSPSPSLPYSRQSQEASFSNYKSVYSSSLTPSTFASEHNQSPSNVQSPSMNRARQISTSDVWERKDGSSLHPAIRQEYGTMFHQQYQPPYQKTSLPQGSQSANQAAHQPQKALQQPIQPSAAQSQQPQHHASQTPTVFAQTYQALQGQLFDDKKPLYPHQQYFQNSQNQHQPEPQASAREIPDVPVDSTTLIEKMMANLRQASRLA